MPAIEHRDIHCTHSENLPALLEELRLSVLISTYQTGHLVVMAARQGRLVLTFHQFERAMGIAVKPGTIAVCTRKEVWFARSAPDYVTLLAESDAPEGWRSTKATGGCLMEVPSGRVVVGGLSLPHSPRVDQGQVYFLHSGQGRLDVADPTTGQITAVAELPGVARGLALEGGYAFVGLSKARPTLDGVPIVAQRDRLQCGLAIVDLRTGSIAAHLEFRTGVEEIFDVQVLPGITFPYIAGPWQERDSGQPLWTVPPAKRGNVLPS